MLLEEAHRYPLVQVDQMVPNLHNILIIALPARAHRGIAPTVAATFDIHHGSYLHLQVLNKIAKIRLLSLIANALSPKLLRLAANGQHLIARLLVYAHNDRLEIDALFDQEGERIVPILQILRKFSSALLQFVLAFQVGAIALLHVLIHSLEPLLILLHALLQVRLGLLLLLEDARVGHLLRLLEFFRHLLLNVQNEGVLVPDAFLVFVLNERIGSVITSDPRQYLLDIGFFDAIPLLLNYLQLLYQVFIIIHGLAVAHFNRL